MRSRSFVALACALSTASVFSCSDDDGGGTVGGGGTNQMVNPLNPAGGGGMSGNSAGPANGGSANFGGNGGGGGSSGAGQGGSANTAGAGGGTGGDGMGGSMMATAGAGGDSMDMDDPPDAGGGDPPDDPPNEDVVFADIFPILRANCGGCHGNPNGLPAFAQANEDAAFAVTENTGAQGQDISQRIIVRAVMLRSMPPGCNNQNFGQGTCIEADEAAALQAWFDQGAEE